MDPGAQLYFATAAFLATHFISATPLRPALVRSVGEKAYIVLYSLLAFATLGWMIWAYSRAELRPLWPGLRLIPALVMPFAFILLACGRIDPQAQIDSGAVSWTGDAELGERAARNLRFTM